MSLDLDQPLLKLRRTKIVATIGPATESANYIAAMIDAGVNVFRLNMSHGVHSGHEQVYQRIRAIAAQKQTAVAVLADLCGPKIRVGEIDAGALQLDDGEQITITTRDVLGHNGGHDKLIPCQYRHLAEDVEPGNRILLDDGLLELRVESIEGPDVRCTVINGGKLKSRKGINLPGVNVSAPALTEKDKTDAAFAAGLGVDFIALSFVRSVADVLDLTGFLSEHECDAAVIAKIEKPEALEQIDEILEAVDGIMVARGDLGVEIDAERVPMIQDQLITKARGAHKPVIVATQMLESMITNPRPTRAEVADVAHAVQSGTDAIMLSGETAVGAYPLDAVKMMNRIARRTEAGQWKNGHFRFLGKLEHGNQAMPLADSVARAASLLSRDLLVRAIVVVCHSGLSVTIASSARPAAPIIAVSDTSRSCNKMCLLWGVVPEQRMHLDGEPSACVARNLVVEYQLGEPGQNLLLIQGFSNDPDRNTPSITVLQIPEKAERCIRPEADQAG